MLSKVRTIASLLIGFSPAAYSAINNGSNVKQTFADIVYGYSGGLVNANGAMGHFDTAEVAKWYGPLVMATVFHKITGYLMKGWKL